MIVTMLHLLIKELIKRHPSDASELIKASCHGFRFDWCLLALLQGCQPQQYGFSFVWSSGFGLMNQLNEIGCSNKVLLWKKGHLNGLFRILIEEPICEIWALKITTINREVVVLIRIC